MHAFTHSPRWPITLAMAACATLAQGEPAHTSKNVHLRAGPARDYPVVAILPAGLEIEVRGCVADYRWCDVTAGVQRGWVYAGNIRYLYQGSEVPVLSYGRSIGIAVIAFVLLDYWSEHYRSRPWYPDRQRWVHPPRRLPPPPPPVPHPLPHPLPPRGEPMPRPPVPPRAAPPSDNRAPPRAGAPSERRAPPPSQGTPRAPAPHAAPPAPHPVPPGPRPAPGQRQAPGSHGPREGG